MVRYQAADGFAAEELVRLLSPPLLRFLSSPRYTRDQNEDLLQECWLEIHKARHTFRPDAPVLPWVFAVARHTRCRGYRRQHRIHSREIIVEEYHAIPASAPPPEHQRQQDLLRGLAQLPASQREVLSQLKVAGMSLEEVARATSSTVGSVKQKAHRAYERLRRLCRQDTEAAET
jgi:RNA polymerase sigma-70 factor (ECF subfamily)